LQSAFAPHLRAALWEHLQVFNTEDLFTLLTVFFLEDLQADKAFALQCLSSFLQTTLAIFLQETYLPAHDTFLFFASTVATKEKIKMVAKSANKNVLFISAVFEL